MRHFVISFIAALLVVAGALFGAARPAGAVTTGHHWVSHSIGFVTHLDNSTGGRWKPAFDAANDWNAWRTGANFNLYPTLNAPKISVVWGYPPYGNSGWTSVRWDYYGHFTSATITISTALKTASDARLRALITHEFGHAIGLAHTTYYWSIMPWNHTMDGWRPMAYDNADMRRIYGARL